MELSERTKSHDLDEDADSRVATVKEATEVLLVILERVIPPCDEKVVALERLQESMFWANAGISRNQGGS